MKGREIRREQLLNIGQRVWRCVCKQYQNLLKGFSTVKSRLLVGHPQTLPTLIVYSVFIVTCSQLQPIRKMKDNHKSNLYTHSELYVGCQTRGGSKYSTKILVPFHIYWKKFLVDSSPLKTLDKSNRDRTLQVHMFFDPPSENAKERIGIFVIKQQFEILCVSSTYYIFAIYSLKFL